MGQRGPAYLNGGDSLDKKSIILIAAGHLANDSNGGAIPALLTFCVANLGYNYEMAAGLAFASCILSTIAQPAFGVLADKISKSWLIPLGILINGISLGIAGFFSDYWTIFFLIMLSGLGGALFHPEAARLVNRIAGEKKGTALSIFSVGGNAGFAIGPLVLSTALFIFGMHGTLVMAVMAVCFSLAIFIRLQQLNPEEPASGSVKAAAETGRNDWGSFSKLSFCIIARSLSFTFCNTFIPLFFLRVLQLDSLTSSHLLTVLFSVGLISTLLGGVFADRFGYVRVLRFTSILMVPSFLLMAYVRDLYTALFLLIPIGISVFTPFSSIVVMGQQYLRRSIGFASGVTLGISISFGGVLAPFMGKYADTHGLLSLFFFITAVNLLGLIFSFTLREKPQKQ